MLLLILYMPNSSKSSISNFMGKSGINSIHRKFAKFVMLEFKVQHNFQIILNIQVSFNKEIEDFAHLLALINLYFQIFQQLLKNKKNKEINNNDVFSKFSLNLLKYVLFCFGCI